MLRLICQMVFLIGKTTPQPPKGGMPCLFCLLAQSYVTLKATTRSEMFQQILIIKEQGTRHIDKAPTAYSLDK